MRQELKTKDKEGGVHLQLFPNLPLRDSQGGTSRIGRCRMRGSSFPRIFPKWNLSKEKIENNALGFLQGL